MLVVKGTKPGESEGYTLLPEWRRPVLVDAKPPDRIWKVINLRAAPGFPVEVDTE